MDAPTSATIIMGLQVVGNPTIPPISIMDTEQRRYRVTGMATLGTFLEGVIDERSVPLGWCARREANPSPTLTGSVILRAA